MVIAMVNLARLVHRGDTFERHRRRATRSRETAIAGFATMSNPRVVAVVPATMRCASLVSPFGNARLASSRAALRTRTRGVASLDAASVVPDADSPRRKHLHPPAVYVSEPGEEVLMQFGESMRVEELPEGTRVVYPGVRANASSDAKTMRAMVEHALDNPIGQPPLREKIRRLLKAKRRPKILFAFDDVSIPLPPMRSPDIRAVILEEAERRCMEEGIDARDVKFVCSIALHRYIREEEFRHVCGAKLFRKYYGTGQMTNWNAVDREFSVEIGVTSEGEKVRVANEFAEADLMVYANVNYVAMDGGYKSYATGLVHYETLAYNHDSSTLKRTRSLFDPPRSALHRSIVRIGKVMQKHTDVFHVETVLDDNRFPWYLSWVQIAWRQMGFLQKLVARVSCFLLKFLPNWLRLWVFWGPLVRGPFGLVQVVAGETEAVHEKTLRKNYEDSVVDVDGQADVLVLAPTCIGPYTKDTYLNPLLVNTYALGYYYNMYVGGVPLLRQGGAMVIVNPMPYRWTTPTHDAYRAIFEEAVGPLGPDRFEELQRRFATDDALNDIYRAGSGPAAVHGFYMYTWAAHGMEKVGKVFVVGAEDDRGPSALGWEKCDSVTRAVAAAREWLDDPNAKATFWQCPPVGYARVAVGSARERARIAADAVCPKEKAKRLELEARRSAAARAEEAEARAEAQAEERATPDAEEKRFADDVSPRRDAAGPNASPSSGTSRNVAKARAERVTAVALANARAPVPRGLATRREERDMWLGAMTVPPPHLDGSVPGDQGFDPLGLGVDPARLAWYQEAELAHGRWAMAAVVGVVAAEAVGAAPWWSVGAAPSRALPVNALLAIQFSSMSVLELKRLRGFLATGESGVWSSFPFDPLGLRSDANRVAEVKHGRLGMLAFAGIAAQAVVYRAGALVALRDHVDDPFGCNLVSNVAHIGQTFEAVASQM